MEMVGSYLDSTLGGVETIAYLVQVTLEEFMEMTGTLIFLYALLSYIAVQIGAVEILIKQLDSKQHSP